ncbi:MAG: polysulfide reductase NrfD [Deltaproteobacteria bacterium]|nr:polysulfide reductase NrfD [Deltaproteobacteria bacterium]
MPSVEVSVLGSNAIAGPPLQIWGWEIGTYLFAGGLVAGLLVITGFAHRRGRGPMPASLAWWGPALAPVLLTAGMLALFLDLEHRWHAFRFYTTLRLTAPMSWGAWILLLVYPASVLFALGAWREFGPPLSLPGWLSAVSAWAERRRVPLAGINIGLGVALGLYTGLLLSAFGARPLWNSALLGPLFLISGLSTGAAALALLESSEPDRERLSALDLKLIGAEAATLALLLVGLTTGGAAQRAASQLFLGGSFTALFWVAVVLAGLAMPALLELLHRLGRAQDTVYAQVLVLLGGFALRMVFLLAGQASRWGTMQ